MARPKKRRAAKGKAKNKADPKKRARKNPKPRAVPAAKVSKRRTTPKAARAPARKAAPKPAPARKTSQKVAQGPRRVMVGTPEQQKLADRIAAELRNARSKLSKMRAALAQTKAGLKKLQAQDERKKARKRRRKEREAPAESEARTFKAKIGKTTHISATEIDGEPQYVWRELEERSAEKLVRTKPNQPRRWARLVVELSRESLLFPQNYRRLRGKAVIRTSWHPAHELVGKAARVMDNLQQSGAVVPRAKIVIVESKKKPPGRVF